MAEKKKKRYGPKPVEPLEPVDSEALNEIKSEYPDVRRKNIQVKDERGSYTPEYVAKKILDYEDYLASTDKPPTRAGLAFFSGISRSALDRYAQDPRYADTVGKFCARIDMFMEEELLKNKPGMSGTIFLAKNLGYTDKQEITVTGRYEEYSDQELQERIKRLEALNNDETIEIEAGGD